MEQEVQSSIGLLQRMSEDPKVVLAALNPAERERVITKLGALADQSAGVVAEADLQDVINELYRLVEDTRDLNELLLSQGRRAKPAKKRPTTRKITFGYDKRAYDRPSYAQERAAQIRNYVVQCHERLVNALPKVNDGR